MEKVIIIALLIALVGLLFSRIHFHFTFSLDVSRSSRLHSANRNPSDFRRERKAAVGSRPVQMAMGTTGKQAGVSGGAPAVRSISDTGVTKALEAARKAAEGDLVSALLNLGCDRQKAQKLAKDAMTQGEDFDSRVRWAMQHAA
jgi:hypothetical protein